MPDRSGAGGALRRWLLALVLAAALAAGVQRSWGDVQVAALRFPTAGGQWVAADLFRPRTATMEHPAPLVVVVPGFQRSKEALQNVAIELSRRGVVALVIDPYALAAGEVVRGAGVAEVVRIGAGAGRRAHAGPVPVVRQRDAVPGLHRAADPARHLRVSPPPHTATSPTAIPAPP